MNSGSLELLCFRLGVLAIFSTRWNRFLASGCFVVAIFFFLLVVADLQGGSFNHFAFLLLGIGNWSKFLAY